MHFTSLVAVLAAASVAQAALTYNVTKALTKENFKKYKCLCVYLCNSKSSGEEMHGEESIEDAEEGEIVRRQS
jgi:hypothetical protein